MAIPVITPLPPAPTPSDSPDVFASKAGSFVTAQVSMVPEINASFTWVSQQVTTIDGYRQAAAASAQTATEQAGIATGAGDAAGAQVQLAKDQVQLAADQVQLAATQANNAAASAIAAEGAPGSIGNLALIQAVALLF